jgi:hypothetical protein
MISLQHISIGSTLSFDIRDLSASNSPYFFAGDIVVFWVILEDPNNILQMYWHFLSKFTNHLILILSPKYVPVTCLAKTDTATRK